MSRQVVTLLAVLCVALFIVACRTEQEVERSSQEAAVETQEQEEDFVVLPREDLGEETLEEARTAGSAPQEEAPAPVEEAADTPAPSTEADGDPDPSAELDGVETQAWDPSQSAFPPRPVSQAFRKTSRIPRWQNISRTMRSSIRCSAPSLLSNNR